MKYIKNILIKAYTATHNIKQLGFSGFRCFCCQFSNFFVGQVRSLKTKPFHIVNRQQQL